MKFHDHYEIPWAFTIVCIELNINKLSFQSHSEESSERNYFEYIYDKNILRIHTLFFR